MKLSRRTVMAGVAASAASAVFTPALSKGRAPITSELDAHDAMGLAEQVKAKQISPAELLDMAIARVEELNPRFNFMAQRHYDYARTTLNQKLPDGPFAGVPYLLTDLNTYIDGEISENGSRIYKGHRAAVTSILVERSQAAGFVIFGKTTTAEFGLNATTENKLNGDTLNPWKPGRSAGGASGGAAAAVALGIIPAAHAADGRIPASCCGLFGLKPSRGRVPLGPHRTEGWGALAAPHAITRSVRDSAAILDATWGVEPGSRYGAPTPDGTFLSQLSRKPDPLRIALMLEPLSKKPVDPECIAAVRDAASLCERLGHIVEEASSGLDPADAHVSSFVSVSSSAAADIEDRAKALGITPGPDTLEAMTLAFIEHGRKFTAMDAARQNHKLQQVGIKIGQFFERYDIILSPTLATPPIKLGRLAFTAEDDFQSWGNRVSGFSPFCEIWSHTGQPSMSVPLGVSIDGLPVGVLFSGRYGEEAMLFRLAAQLEKAAPWNGRRAAI